MPSPPTNDRTLLQPLSRALEESCAESQTQAKRLAAIRVDQRREWQAGRRVLAEAYLARFPELAADVAVVEELVFSEFQLRLELGDNPTDQEYLHRFPRLATQLNRRFAHDGASTDRSQLETVMQPATQAPPATIDASLERFLGPPQPRVPAPDPGRTRPTVPGYDLLGELGRGAMGVVYRARQKALGREVALKMVLSGNFAGTGELERFRTEAIQLAKLQHPNIVQIYEVGEHDGRPYFAMEFIPGGNLSKLLEKKPLAPRPAAEMVATLARAMEHAHERGIIHRDLKPANIMLAADGSPKITDFGLAKGTGSAGDTASYAILGTPSYMAPEQAGGHSRDVGPAADVYALGSILYESLTGRPPFRAASILDTIQLVMETEPVPPGDLTINLPRDVETITLKCLQKLPAKRYASAAELADDLQRFLDDKPILARPVPVWEKVWKWSKRRPAWAALIATIMVAASGLIGGGLWFNSQVRHERDIAVANANLAENRFQTNREAVDKYFTEVSESDLLDEPGLQPLREKLLKLARDYYARFVEERKNDPAVRADLARSLSRLARITADLKDPREAINLHLQALPIFQELADANPDDLGPRTDIAATWYELSKLYRQTKQTATGETACTNAIDLWGRLAHDHPAEAKYRAELARSLISQSNLLFSLDKLEPSRASCEQALAIRQKLVADNPKDEVYTRDLASAWDNLANIRAVARQWPESNAARKEAGDLFRKLVTANPFRAVYRNDLARSQFNLGTSLITANEPQPAADSFREAASQWDRLHALHPTVLEYQRNLGNALFALVGAEWRLAEQPNSDDSPRKAADATLEKARAVRADLANQYPAVPDYAIELARCEAEAGDHALQRFQPTVAVDWFRRAADRVAAIVEQHKDVPPYRADLARYRLNLGKSLAQAGQPDLGRTAIREALDLWQGLRSDPAVGPEAEVETLDCFHALGDLEQQAGRQEQAMEWYDRSLAGCEALARRMPPIPGVSLRQRDAWWGKAKVLTALKQYPDSIYAWDQATNLADGDALEYLKIYRLATLARTSEYEQSLIELDPLAVIARSTKRHELFDVARVYALAAQTAAADKKLAQPDRDRRTNEIAQRAIENLQLALSKGYFADATVRNDLANNPDLSFLRGRPDFQKLLTDAAAPLRPVNP